MINTTDRLEILAEGAALHRATSKAIATAAELLEGQANHNTRPSNLRIYGFGRLLGAQNRIEEARYDRAFLDAAFHFCISHSQDTEAQASYQTVISRAQPIPVSAASWGSLRRGLKLMLVELWRQRTLLLPTIFLPAPHFPLRLFDHQLLTWIQNVSVGEESHGLEHPPTRNLREYGARLVLTADWQSPRDISLKEVAALHSAQALYAQGKSSVAIAPMIPFSLFSAQLLRDFPEQVTYDIKDLARYSVWAMGHSMHKVPFEDFTPTPRGKRKSKRIGTPEGVRKTVLKRSVDHATIVAEAARENTHGAIMKAFQSLQRGRPASIDWQQTAAPSYPARELVDLTAVAPTWVRTFRAFMRHRKHVKEYRSSGEIVASLNLLADYLFFYLPWWKQMHPLGKVALPTSPRDFSRFAFVARDAEVAIEELPVPLLQMIPLRRPTKDSAYVAVRHLTQFFDFVRTHFGEDDDVAGRGFLIPINGDFDSPRLKKRTKTTKEIIPKNVYGHLLFYCYAVEQFGQHLQQLALQKQLPWQRGDLRNAQRFACAEFGHAPIVAYRGNEIELDSVPNVFIWMERQVRSNVEGSSETVYMPHATALRVLITSLETGLRCQSVQWLDRSSWDSLNVNLPPDSYTCALLVNTDKTRGQAWNTYVVHRVRELLQREENFQASFFDADRFGPINYEGLENSQFGPIQPLFRSADSAYPVSDNAYADAWVDLMVGFEEFYQRTTGERQVRMTRMKVLRNPDSTPVIRFRNNKDRGPYCAISVLAIHTPHSCRATFATNRRGVLELSDVADLLGHQSEVVTAYYTKPSTQALRERLRESDTAIVSEYAMFDASSEVHIRADRPDSGLVRSFSRDREGTLQRFKFMPSIALWSTEDTAEGGEGLKLLKDGPMSRIRFRETHICPVGEECPGNIVEQIGAPRRCGVCPLAMKCVDHLPAIAAKKNQLVERIKYLHRHRSAMEKAGEPVTALDEVWDQLELDVNELLGWQLSEEILTGLRKEVVGEESGGKVLHVDRPEIVRRHLERVTRSCDSTELILQRIADSNAYPTLSTPEVQAAAARIKRRLLAGSDVDEIESWVDDLEDVRSVAKMLMLMMKTSGASMSDVVALVSTPNSAPSANVLLLPRGANG
jgi:hypothetical protein